ncbi:MAG TPA: adenylyl-sulfate reductase [Gammaproteobacteria bacterium]|nr:adenylyl-sulfate reductase [Gammaproteobacteria bacterium]
MQAYVVLMFILVVAGTLLDVAHKKSAKYFAKLTEEQKRLAKRDVSSQKAGIAIGVVANEVLTSSEFSNPKRRLSHLLTMYGFVFLVLSTAVLIFGYGTSEGGGFWGLLWHLGALMLVAGSYWFWFGIRVDVFAEGHPVTDIKQRDIFILGLMSMGTFALLWSIFRGVGGLNWLFFVLFIVSATVLFSTVLWSKFAHMFFKPAAAFQKKTAWADGSREKLPDIPDLSSAEVHQKFPDIPKYMGDRPGNMGLGIKRERPNHY